MSNIYWLPLYAPDCGPNHNPGMCPDRNPTQPPFLLQDDTQLSHTGQGTSPFFSFIFHLYFALKLTGRILLPLPF